MSYKNQRMAFGVLGLSLVTGFGLVGIARAQEVKSYEDYKILRVDLKAPADLTALRGSGAQILNCVPGVGPMDVLASPDQFDRIGQLGLRTQILHEDAQALFGAQRPVASRADPFTDFFLDYHEYGSAGETGTILWYMNELVSMYPSLASMIEVGTTLELRTIWGLRITNDTITDKPGVVYFGAEHSREWITPTAPLYFATYLLENYGTDATVTDLVDNVEFFLIPVFNVDGYIYTWTTDRMWRKNRRNNGGGIYGVDINRNWGEGWGWDDLGSSPYPSDETYRGPSAFSEPETQELRDFFYAHPNVRTDNDIHSYGQLILWPWGYKGDLPPDQDVFEEVGYGMQALIYGVHGREYAAGPIYSAIYPVNGGSVDWTYAEMDLLSISFELRPLDWTGGGFELPPDQIIPNNEEILPALLLQANSDWVRAPLRFRFPNGRPHELIAGVDTTVDVEIIGQLESVLAGSPRLYYRYDLNGPFIELPLTPTGGDGYTVLLPATNCTSRAEFYFTATGTGGSTITSPKGAPTEVVYTALVSTDRAPFFAEDLGSNPGWTTEGAWAWGWPTGAGGEYGGPDPYSGHTGDNVYGYNLSGDYANNLPERHLTSAPIDCTGHYGVHLSFWRWLNVEQPAYDHAYVRVSNNGTDWVTVWENQAEITDSSWSLQDVNISAVADDQPTVYLRWTMGPTDSGWRYSGWNIDDIALTDIVCDGITGDYNGDGDVDTGDFAQFELCYTGPTGPVGPGCGIFDFDVDDHVDCDDWSAFEAAWTGPGDLPAFGPCDAFSAPTFETLTKNRYLSFTPGGSTGLPQAFRVTTVSNPLFPETVDESKWVGPPDADGVARLQCAAEYRDWGFTPVHIGDEDIVPGATYGTEATLDGVDFLSPVSMMTVSLWGDVVGNFVDGAWNEPDGNVDFDDISATVDGFRMLPTAPTTERCDLYPAVPDGVIDFDDIGTVVDAFRSLPYRFEEVPGSCP